MSTKDSKTEQPSTLHSISKRYFAKVKYFPCDGSEPILTTDEIQAESLKHAESMFIEIWHMNAELIHVYE